MLMRTDPFRELDRVAQQVFGTAARPAVMPMDAYRDGETFVAHFDLPGVRTESIDLQVERNVLTIRAERTAVNSGPDEKRELVVAERPAGVFTRQLFLGETLDTENIAADYTDGVLTLRIPVAEKAKPKRISVSSTSGARQIDA